MRRLLSTLSLLALAALGGSCGPGPDLNPPQLWLALDGDELHAKLASSQPPHY